MDRDAADLPSLGVGPVSASGSGVAVKVLHAQDVDVSGYPADATLPPAQVEVRVWIGSVQQPADVCFRRRDRRAVGRAHGR